MWRHYKRLLLSTDNKYMFLQVGKEKRSAKSRPFSPQKPVVCYIAAKPVNVSANRVAALQIRDSFNWCGAASNNVFSGYIRICVLKCRLKDVVFFFLNANEARHSIWWDEGCSAGCNLQPHHQMPLNPTELFRLSVIDSFVDQLIVSARRDNISILVAKNKEEIHSVVLQEPQTTRVRCVFWIINELWILKSEIHCSHQAAGIV